MKLPKKFQGCFDWTVAPSAINAGHQLDIFSNGLWREKICHETVRSDERYRVRPPREFPEGWYEYDSGGAWLANNLIYRSHDSRWWWAGIHADNSPDVDESRVGERIK